jgi:OmpA-OmpF porin, OOP family
VPCEADADAGKDGVMKNQRRTAAGLMMWGLVVLLAGCSGWSFQPPMRGNVSFAPYNLGKLRAAVPASPGTFTQGLTSDYAGLAGSLQDELRDWADADYFARKGLAAAGGEVVPPENNSNWLVPLEVPEQFRTQLSQSRDRLVAALDGGGRERLPLVAARAQVSYDCWVERMEDDWKAAIDGPCHKQFLDAMAQLEGHAQPAAKPAAAPGPAREFRVYFEFDKAELLPEAQQILQQVAAIAKQGSGLRIVLVGKADRAGSDGYNLRLSKRRAEQVHNALLQDGVPASRIETRWVGEREPPVPTPDGVREPRNRVVEINLR